MTDLQQMGQRAVAAKTALQALSPQEKGKALRLAAVRLIERQEEILRANAKDMEAARANGFGKTKQVKRESLTCRPQKFFHCA